MRTMLLATMVALVLGPACDRKRDDKPVVEVKKPVEQDEPSSGRDVKAPPVDLGAERARLVSAIEERAARLDARIDELEKRGDVKSKETVAMLRAKRDQARAKLSELGSRTQENWQRFERDVADTWSQLERDLDEALREEPPSGREDAR